MSVVITMHANEFSRCNFVIDGCTQKRHLCQQCSFVTETEALLKEHAATMHSKSLLCPLCSDRVADVTTLELHLFSVHHVKEEAAHKLLTMLDAANSKSRTNRELSSFARKRN